MVDTAAAAYCAPVAATGTPDPDALAAAALAVPRQPSPEPVACVRGCRLRICMHAWESMSDWGAASGVVPFKDRASRLSLEDDGRTNGPHQGRQRGGGA